MEYAATIVAPSIEEATAALDSLYFTSLEIEDMGDGTFQALMEIDEASENELEETGEITYSHRGITVTISLP